MRIVIAAVTVTLATASASADDTACLTAAFNEYNNANLAIMEQSTPVMTVQATIAQRRLQEKYCLRVVQCRVGSDASGILTATAFTKCLDVEAREHLRN